MARPSPPPDETFPSAVDLWLAALVLAAIALCLQQAWSLRFASPTGALIALLTGLFTAAIVIAFGIPCRYTLAPTHLLIRCGLIRRRVAYADITGVTPSANPTSAPAWSLRRVQVQHGRHAQLISPRERERFMQALQQRVAAARPG